jgi:hypothetical protein
MAGLTPAGIAMQGPGYGDIMGKVEEGIGSKLYEPQTMLGRVEEKAIGLAPAAFGGEGSVAMRIGQNVLAPAIAGEAGGYTAEKMLGKQFRPVGELAGMTAAALTPSLARLAVGAKPPPADMQGAVDTLKREGITPTAGQATGSKRLRYFEAESGGQHVADVMTQQKEQLTKAAASRAGIDATRLTPDVIDEGFTTLGNNFKTLGQGTSFNVTQNFKNNVKAVGQGYRIEPAYRSPAVTDALDTIKAWKVGKTIPGSDYINLRSQLAADIRSTNVGANKKALGKIIEALDDVMDQGLNPKTQAAFRRVRQQYRNMLVLEKTMKGSGSDIALGYVTPSQLRTAAKTVGKRSFSRGKDDFSALSNAAEAALKPLPDSGTAGRLGGTLANLAVRMTAGGAGGAALGLPAGPLGVGIGAVAGAVAPGAIGRAALTKPIQQWLQSRLAGSPGLTTGLAGLEAVRSGHQMSEHDKELWRRSRLVEELLNANKGQGQ